MYQGIARRAIIPFCGPGLNRAVLSRNHCGQPAARVSFAPASLSGHRRAAQCRKDLHFFYDPHDANFPQRKISMYLVSFFVHLAARLRAADRKIIFEENYFLSRKFAEGVLSFVGP